MRIWAGAGLQVPKKRTRKRYRSPNRQPLVATAPNEVWVYDFVFDACANSQKLKCLTLIDELTKESFYIDLAGSIRSQRSVEVLEQVIAERGYPKTLLSDHGPESISTILLEWAAAKGLHNLHIELGKPWQNSTHESFNGKFGDERLALNWFYSGQHAKVIIKTWRKHYNLIRSHSSLDYQTPLEFLSEWRYNLTPGVNVSK